MAYTALDGSTFEPNYPHRDINNFPGTEAFQKIIKAYTAQINTFLNVDEDICSWDEDTEQAESLNDIIGDLIEARLNWLETRRRTPTAEVAKLLKPNLFQDTFSYLRDQLTTIKGGDSTIEGSSFLFETRSPKGEGFEF